MRFRVLVTSLLALPVLALAGCGSDDEEGRSAGGTTATATEPQATTSVPETSPVVLALYFVRDGKLGFAQRATTSGPQVGTAALNELLKGPTAADRTAGLTTDIPSGTSLERLAIEDGVAQVELSKPLGEPATAQVVFTLTSFPTVRRVELEGEQHVRSDFEEVTPAVLVESPAPGDQVTSPLRIAGTANTFEATFQVEVLGSGRRVLGKRFVTATSGSGTRGSFDAAVTFAAQPGPATLVVYELSAEDGSRINEVEIPLEIRVS
jgi:germination protein M